MKKEKIGCTGCGGEMKGIRVVPFSSNIEDSGMLREVIDGRCVKCRDDYGVIYDALRVSCNQNPDLPALSGGESR